MKVKAAVPEPKPIKTPWNMCPGHLGKRSIRRWIWNGDMSLPVSVSADYLNPVHLIKRTLWWQWRVCTSLCPLVFHECHNGRGGGAYTAAMSSPVLLADKLHCLSAHEWLSASGVCIYVCKCLFMCSHPGYENSNSITSINDSTVPST